MTPGWRREFRLITLGGDLIALSLGFEVAIRLRLALNVLFRAQLDEARMAHLIPPLGLILILWVITSAWFGLYRARRGPFPLSAAARTVEAMALVLVLTIVVSFFVRDLGRDYSRSFIVFLAALGTTALLANRALLWAAFRVAERRGVMKERVLLVGRGRGVKSLIARLERTARGRIDICGVVTPMAGEGAGVLGNPVPVVGAIAELPVLINRHRADRVIVVEKEVSAEDLHSCVATCTRMGVPLNHTTGPLEKVSLRVGMTEVGDMLLVEVRGIEFTRVQQVIKRAFDLAVASALLVLLAPLMLALGALIKLTSPGPVLYVAPRVGRGGRYFPFYKFRSMVCGADAQRDNVAGANEKAGHLFKIRHDPRVTAVGRLMRRVSLDELPQILNVLRGEMSLVGPRPLPARDLEPDGLSVEHRTWAVQRSKIPPGITGLWQIRGRSDLSFEDMLRLDIGYVRHWSVWLDFKILFLTLPAVLRGKGAC